MDRSNKQPKRSRARRGASASDHRVDPPTGLKLWLFRAVVVVLVPMALLLLLELGLKITGFGYPSSFLLETESNGKELFVQNDRFGWRFFGPDYSRTPQTFAIPRKAPDDTVRIFVMGESAALGDPQPDFGMPRILNAMMSLRYPSTRFEVVNVAMTAINSHVIREIASDCARADGDIWVLYIGNNEVVGPYGSGTVFGPQVPPLTTIRAGLALKTTRTGQMLDAIRARLNPPEAGKGGWGGMMMFLDQQVAYDDPRMEHVYDHFRRNLEDIIALGRKAGAGIAVCNVAVNLKDCAPFSSQLQSDTPAGTDAAWKQHYQRGTELQERGEWAAASAAYAEAEILDEQVAELHFRKGQCALALNDTAMASLEFSRARDLDTLRFRFDSRMSSLVNSVVSRQNDPQVRFVDAEAAFAAESPDEIPGWEFFYEHVHLTWEGNRLLAREIAEQIDAFLPDHVRNADDALPAWPTADQCARRLAWTDWERLQCLSDVRGRLADPPFTLQLNHEKQMTHLGDAIGFLVPAQGSAGLQDTLRACEAAVEVTPDDTVLLRRLVKLRLQSGDGDSAVAAARRVTELLPHASSAWDDLATTLAQLDRLDEAVEYFEQGLRLDPEDIWLRHHLAQAYARTGNTEKALMQWNQVVKLQPKFGTAYLLMGQVLESQGKTAEANTQYQKALANPVNRSADLALLARLCIRKGWYDAALKHLRDAALLSPTDAAVRYDLANVLKAQGRDTESTEQLALARRYDTNAWISFFQKGVEHGRAGRPQEAAESFREVVRMKPDLIEGHLNLAIALSELNVTDEAIHEFNRVLELNPAHEQALRYLEALGAEATP